MLAKTLTCAVVGLEGALVEVEVDIGPGLPAFNIVGLPDAAVQEAKERVRAAVKNSGCVFPQRRITVLLPPADLKKEGSFRQTGKLELYQPFRHHRDGAGRSRAPATRISPTDDRQKNATTIVNAWYPIPASSRPPVLTASAPPKLESVPESAIVAPRLRLASLTSSV